MKSADAVASALLLYLCKLVILKFQPIAYVNAVGQQGDGNFGDNTGVVVFDGGIISTNVNNSTEHSCLLFETAPVTRGGSY